MHRRYFMVLGSLALVACVSNPPAGEGARATRGPIRRSTARPPRTHRRPSVPTRGRQRIRELTPWLPPMPPMRLHRCSRSATTRGPHDLLRHRHLLRHVPDHGLGRPLPGAERRLDRRVRRPRRRLVRLGARHRHVRRPVELQRQPRRLRPGARSLGDGGQRVDGHRWGAEDRGGISRRKRRLREPRLLREDCRRSRGVLEVHRRSRDGAARAGLKLVISVPPKTSDDPGNTWAYPYDYAALAPHVDHLQVMTYDENGPGWSGPGPVSGLDWMGTYVAYVTSLVPPSKVLIGLPAYAYDWDLTASTPSKSVGTSVSWKDVPAILARPSAVTHWDATSSTPYVDYTSSDGHQHEVWYDDAASITPKAALAGKHGTGRRFDVGPRRRGLVLLAGGARGQSVTEPLEPRARPSVHVARSERGAHRVQVEVGMCLEHAVGAGPRNPESNGCARDVPPLGAQRHQELVR